MSIEDNGGTAFPAQFFDERATGMTLRDYFAAKAVAAFISVAPSGTEFGVSHQDINGGYAKAAYAMADAMLEARNK